MEKIEIMDGDQVAVLFVGFLFLVGGIGFLFVRVDERAEEQDRKRGWATLPRTNFFSPYFFFQVPWYKWVTSGFFLILAAVFISHAFGLLDQFL